MMSKEKRRVPKLRFPGFTEDWEQRKLGECIDISTGYPFDSQDFNENGEYLVITNGNIQENTPFVLNNVGNRIDLDDSLKKYILDIDDLLITMDGTVGRVAIVVNNKLVLAQRVCRIKSNEPYYIYQLLSKNNFIQSMNKIGHGGTIKHISLSEISEYQDFYPKSQKERIKISTVLTNCDKLITLHQRKLNNLKLKRKALLQKLFPKNGEGYPELRFPGFTDAWEQRKLGDVADVRDGTHDSPKFYNDGFPLVTSKNLKDGSIDFSDCSFISKQDFDEINKRSKVDSGDILFGMIGTIGNPAIVEHTGFAIKNVALIKEGIIVNNRFIYHLLSSKVFDNYIARENAGGTQKFIALNQIRNFIFLAPTLEEQNKIIELLDYISQTITLHQRKLKHLQIQKKSLLQKLFV